MKTLQTNMHIRSALRQQLGTQRLLRNTAAVLIVAMVPTIALASSWNPTLLVNTEAFQTIEDGDGSTNIELRFGATGSGLQLNVTTGQFEFDSGVEIQGTASGRQIHAQDLLTTSGSLVVEEGQTVFLNGIEYLFPSTDNTDGFVLTTDGNGNLSWTNKTAGSLTQGSGDDRYVNQSGDTMTGALVITPESGDLALEVNGTLSGTNINATDSINASGALVVEGAATFGSTFTINGVTYTFPFGDGAASGRVLATDGAGQLSWTESTDNQNLFETFAVSGQDNVVADSATDTINFAAGSNVTITTNATTDTITIAATDTSQQTTFTLSGDAGDDQTISQGNTLEIAGGDSITTTGSATDTITVDITDDTVDFTELEDTLELDATTQINLGSSNFQIDLDSSGDFEILDAGSSQHIFADDGSVIFNELGNDANIRFEGDTEQNLLFMDAGTDRIGIGTASPDTELEVVGTISGSTLTITGDNSYFLGNVSFGTSAAADTEVEVVGTASGTILRATDALTSSGTLTVEGGITFRTLASCTNITTDSNGVLTCNNTDYIEETELDTEAELEAQLTDVSNVIIEAEIDSESELEAIVGVDFLKGNEIDTEAELESFLTNVSNVFTNNDGSLSDDDLSDNDTDDLSEGSNLYFTNERVDDRVAALLQQGSGITLSYDDTNGTLTINQGASSGAQVSLSPEYAGAVYYGDGSNNVGQLVLEYDSSNAENYYKWTSTQSSLNDYTIAVRVKVPDEFSHWDGTAPIQFRYRTNAASSDDNQIDITMLDTAGSSVALTGGANLANTSWTTASITGPESTGTYTAGSYITILINVQARTTNSGEAHVGYLNFNWMTQAR